MLGLLRSRGYVVVEHPDWSVIRVVVGAASRTPIWPPHDDRPRVLVETPSGRWPHEEAARSAGLNVLTCGGPVPATRCPMLRGEGCPLVAGADVVVVARPGDDDGWPALLDVHDQGRQQADRARVLVVPNACEERFVDEIRDLAVAHRRKRVPAQVVR
jgi:hypothetical protein